jgi:hypothetical protein
MSSLLYKRHSIIYCAALDEFTGKLPRPAKSFGTVVKASMGRIPLLCRNYFLRLTRQKPWRKKRRRRGLSAGWLQLASGMGALGSGTRQSGQDN